MNINQAAADKVTRARAALLIAHPFFGTLALRMKMREDPSIETFATNGVDMSYNPEFVLKIPAPQVQTEICHEVMHNALDHIHRRGARDFANWNRACDYPINEMLHKIGMTMDNTYLLEPAFFGMSADHIYSILPPPDPNKPGPTHVQPPPPGTTPQQAQQQTVNWKVAVAQSAMAAKQQGKLPGALEQFVDNLLESRVDWKTALRQFITASNEGDYSWMKPNRMMLGYHGIFLPSLYSEKTKPIVFVKDISGSINDEIQDAFNAECRAIHQDTQPEMLHVMYVDTRVARHDQFGPEDEPKLVNIRGGGTAFEPPFEKLEEMGIEPACLVYLTDMEGSFPEKAPEYPVLWVSIDRNSDQPPFGEMTTIEI